MDIWAKADKELKKIDKLKDDVTQEYYLQGKNFSAFLATASVGTETLIVFRHGGDYPREFVIGKENALLLRDFLNKLFEVRD